MAKSPKPVITFHVNGEPITNPSVNMLSGIAYFHCRGIDPGKDHVTAGRLKEILADLGVTFKKTEPFDVTLPNGKRIHTTVVHPIGSALVAPSEPAKAPAAKKVTRTAADDRRNIARRTPSSSKRSSGPVAATVASMGALPKGMTADQMTKRATPAKRTSKKATTAKKTTSRKRSSAKLPAFDKAMAVAFG